MGAKKKAAAGVPPVFPPATTEEVMLAKAINDDWNHYLGLTKFAFDLEREKGFRPSSAAANEERIALFVTMQRWCKERKIDVRFWVFALFAGRAWRFPPKTTLGCVCSEEMRKKLPRIRDKDVLRRRLDESPLVNKNVNTPAHELVPHVEQLKRKFANEGNALKCMNEMFTATGGYHPKSSWCVTCPQRQECAKRLAAAHPTDIIGARNAG
jgi:hypothetical protein